MRKKKSSTISKEEYVQTFCTEKRIRQRKVLYVSPEVRHKLQQIVNTFSDYYVTSSSLADAILSHHITQHKELLEQVRMECYQKQYSAPKLIEDEDNYSEEYADGESEDKSPEAEKESEQDGSF